MPIPQLNAAPGPIADHRDRIISSLEEENRDLKEQVNLARHEMESQRSESGRAVAELRKILLPLHQGLKLIFGEMDAIAPDQGRYSEAPANDKKTAIWESWKQKLGGPSALLIQSLLDHGQMNAAQLRVAMKCHVNTVYETTAKMKRLGLISNVAGKFSLREL